MERSEDENVVAAREARETAKKAREEGRALYARNSIQYFSPEQRARYRGR